MIFFENTRSIWIRFKPKHIKKKPPTTNKTNTPHTKLYHRGGAAGWCIDGRELRRGVSAPDGADVAEPILGDGRRELAASSVCFSKARRVTARRSTRTSRTSAAHRQYRNVAARLFVKTRKKVSRIN
jgi:hypothetical protein